MVLLVGSSSKAAWVRASSSLASRRIKPATSGLLSQVCALFGEGIAARAAASAVRGAAMVPSGPASSASILVWSRQLQQVLVRPSGASRPQHRQWTCAGDTTAVDADRSVVLVEARQDAVVSAARAAPGGAKGRGGAVVADPSFGPGSGPLVAVACNVGKGPSELRPR